MQYLMILSIATVLGLGAPVQNPPAGGAAAAAPPAGDAQSGKRLYEDVGCYQCHGYAAHGGGGPRLAPRPLAFAALSRYVRQPTGQMPPYTEKVLTDQQMADIYAFLRSVPEPPAVGSIPILNN